MIAIVLAAALVMGSIANAHADTYWDVSSEVAEQLVSNLNDGDIVIRFCAQCGGNYRVVVLQRAERAKGTYSEEFSVFMYGKLMFSGTMQPPDMFALPNDAQCGEDDGTGERPEDKLPADGEYLDVPYSFVEYQSGIYKWVGIGTQEETGNRALGWDPILLSPRMKRRFAECVAHLTGKTKETGPAQKKSTPAAPHQPPRPPQAVTPAKRGCGCHSSASALDIAWWYLLVVFWALRRRLDIQHSR